MRRAAVVAVFLWALFPMPAAANAGLPLIFITLPAMAIALLPVAAIEAVVLRHLLAVTWWQAASTSLMANLLSTFIGTPIAWLAFFVVELVLGIPSGKLNLQLGPAANAILFAAWSGPTDQGYAWPIALSVMVLLLGFFYISVEFERHAAAQMLTTVEPQELRSAVFKANAITYVGLEIITLGWLLYGLLRTPTYS